MSRKEKEKKQKQKKKAGAPEKIQHKRASTLSKRFQTNHLLFQVFNDFVITGRQGCLYNINKIKYFRIQIIICLLRNCINLHH